MKINRIKLLTRLKQASLGLSSKDIVEQSDCFVFSGGKILTFNDEVMVQVVGLGGFECAVPSKELMALLGKFPDEVVDVSQSDDGQEILITGKKRIAGVPCMAEVRLSFSDVPSPKGWSDLSEDILLHLWNAAMVCGSDETWEKTTCVHVDAGVIEACDNQRLFRAELLTGIKEELLIPASGIHAIKGSHPTKIASGDGWCHFKVKSGVISLRCRVFDKYLDIEGACRVKGEDVQLPDSLKEVASRAKITSEGLGHEARISIGLSVGSVTVKSNSGRGWFSEEIISDYDGPDFVFDVHPDLLSQIIDLSGNVVVGKNRMLVEIGVAKFVIALLQKKR